MIFIKVGIGHRERKQTHQIVNEVGENGKGTSGGDSLSVSSASYRLSSYEIVTRVALQSLPW
jgi:hypothetical protein